MPEKSLAPLPPLTPAAVRDLVVGDPDGPPVVLLRNAVDPDLYGEPRGVRDASRGLVVGWVGGLVWQAFPGRHLEA